MKKLITLIKSNIKSPTFYRRLGIILLLLIIIIRPTLSNERSDRETTNLNIWFVVDASGSMVAKDTDHNNKRRFELAHEDITSIVSNLPGAKYGLLVQDFSSYTAVPMTFNADAITASEAYIRPKYSLYSKPSNLSELLSYSLTRIASYRERYPKRNNVIVFISDGEDVSGNDIVVPNNLSNIIDGAIVLGYGSTDGTTIENIGGLVDGKFYFSAIIEDDPVTYFGDNPNITINDNYQVISKINEDNLQDIASSLNGSYYHRESDTIPQEAINLLSNAASLENDHTDAQTDTNAETYWFFAIILLVLFAWEGEEILLHVLTERGNKNG